MTKRRPLEGSVLFEMSGVVVRIDAGPGHSCFIDQRGALPAFRRVSLPDTRFSNAIDDTWVWFEDVESFPADVSSEEARRYSEGTTSDSNTVPDVIRVGHRHLFMFESQYGPTGWVQAECMRIELVDEVPR